MTDAPTTQSPGLDPLGDATRKRAEIKMTGAQLMDLIDERDASASECEKLKAALTALIPVAESPQSHPGMYGDCVMCQTVEAARALVGSAPQTHTEADE